MVDLEPRIEVHVGPMFSGKSTAMISQLDIYKHAGIQTLLFKPVADTRRDESKNEGETLVKTNNGLQWPAINIRQAQDCKRYITDDVRVVGFDEAFMFNSELVPIAKYLQSTGRVVLAATLNTSYEALPMPFIGDHSEKDYVSSLMALGHVVQHTAVCKHNENGSICGKTARYTHRKAGGTQTFQLGEDDAYEAVCALHHPYIQRHKNLY